MLQISENIPISQYTTLEIGGPTKFLCEINSQNELNEALDFAKNKNISWLIIGSGSNLLVSDDGFPGLIIKNNIQGIVLKDNIITTQAGELLQSLVNFTIEHELDGMSTMTGIPGTVGGAIYGSAGAYGDNIRDYLIEITYLDNNDVKTLTKAEFQTGYRDSFFKHHKNLIILSAKFSGFTPGNKAEMEIECAEIIQKRTTKYPPNQKCPGSFFKNVIATELSANQLSKIPQDKIIFSKVPAGFLLETVDAKGMKLGQIKVAETHANTFINLGGGTAKDFYELAFNLAMKVYLKYGIKLEPEVQFINLPSMKFD